MRKLFKRLLPDHRSVSENRWLRPFASTLLHPRLWHLNRHSAAGAVAVGMFCGLIPGPFQMPGAALLCVLFRVNLPLALITTLYSNPLTIVPLYLAAFAIGMLVQPASHAFYGLGRAAVLPQQHRVREEPRQPAVVGPVADEDAVVGVDVLGACDEVDDDKLPARVLLGRASLAAHSAHVRSPHEHSIL